MTTPQASEARAAWAGRIAGAWQKSTAAIIETGRLLIEAKAALDRHGEWLLMIERDLPFGKRTAQRLMAIAADRRLTNTTHGSLLPPSWRTLYELTRLSDDTFAARIASGAIHPEMERRDAVMADIRERRAQREADLGARQLAMPDKRYSVIYADPPWRWEAWSRETGLERSPESHYPTMALADIKALAIAGVAASDSALFLWATRPILPHGLDAMAAWGFVYKTCFGWEKERIGARYWNRDNLELLLLGVRGSIPAPAPGTQWPALISAPVGRHSEKPEAFYQLIESYFPSLPKIELFARQRRASWDAWGNEVKDGGGIASSTRRGGRMFEGEGEQR